jgi:hypothetical protein
VNPSEAYSSSVQFTFEDLAVVCPSRKLPPI